jgi:hypothetical protein
MRPSLGLHLIGLLMDSDGPVALHEPTWRTPAVVVLTGTRTFGDLSDDVAVTWQRWPPVPRRDAALVHGGFARRTRALLADDALRAFVAAHPDAVLAGHSAGGACACLLASALRGEGRRVGRVVTFGAPRLASKAFVTLYRAQELWDVTDRYAARGDVVTALPPFYYRHLGVPVRVRGDPSSPVGSHSLECYARHFCR